MATAKKKTGTEGKLTDAKSTGGTMSDGRITKGRNSSIQAPTNKTDATANRATQPVQVRFNNSHTSGSYEKLNEGVKTAAEKQVTTATNNAESAYKLAASNNANNAKQSNATNAAVTRQLGTSMKSAGMSQTARNKLSSASARSASTISTAHTNADRNAKATRDTSVSKAKVSAYSQMAKNTLANSEADIKRGTAKKKEAAQREFQHKEAAKGRNLENAIWRKNQKLVKAQNKYRDKQQNLSTYSKTLPDRYSSVKAVDKAIANLKKSKKSSGSMKAQKLAYLNSLRAALLKKEAEEKKAARSGGRRGGRGGRRYRRYGYKSSGGDNEAGKKMDVSTVAKAAKKAVGKGLKGLKKSGLKGEAGGEPVKGITKDAYTLMRGREKFIQKNEKLSDKNNKKKTYNTGKGRYNGNGKRVIGKKSYKLPHK